MTRNFLFLQGPSGDFFPGIADALAKNGHGVFRINLCVGDQFFWRRKGATNYRGKLKDWPAFISNYLDENKITDILLIGEQRPHHKDAIRLAKERAIQVVVTDFGYLRPDWITLEKEGMSAASLFPRDPEAIMALAANAPEPNLERVYEDSFWEMALNEMLYHLSSFFFWWLFPHYKSFKVENPLMAYLGTGKRMLSGKKNAKEAESLLSKFYAENTPFYVFPLQMENDYQIRAYSDFDDLDRPIEMVIESFAKHAPEESHLICKVHPYDPGLKDWRKRIDQHAISNNVFDRVHFMDGGDLNEICQHTKGMVTVNSTSGLQALLADVPLITLGEAIYDVPGLTHQDGLDSFWQDAKEPDSELRDAFIKAMLASIQIRGVFYREEGCRAAIEAAVYRLENNLINNMIPGKNTGE